MQGCGGTGTMQLDINPLCACKAWKTVLHEHKPAACNTQTCVCTALHAHHKFMVPPDNPRQRTANNSGDAPFRTSGFWAVVAGEAHRTSSTHAGRLLVTYLATHSHRQRLYGGSNGPPKTACAAP